MAKFGNEIHDQVASLEVTGLFGRFNHLVKFNPLSDLTIITAPNGYGKTMLIRIIDAFFNRRLHFFWKLDFEEITIEFSSSKSVSISRELESIVKGDDEEADDNAEQKTVVAIRSSGFGHDDEFYYVKPIVSSRATAYIDRHLPVERMGAGRWFDVSIGEALSTIEVLEKFGHLLPETYAVHTKIPTWLAEAIEATDTHLIETQRLLSLEPEEDSRFRTRATRPRYSSVVDNDAEDLSNRIGNILTEYANESQKLDESFPKRIIDVFSDSPDRDTLQAVDDEEKIRARLSELGIKRDRLVEVGLIGETISEPIRPSDILQQEILRKFL